MPATLSTTPTAFVTDLVSRFALSEEEFDRSYAEQDAYAQLLENVTRLGTAASAGDTDAQFAQQYLRLGLPADGITYHRLHIGIDAHHASAWFAHVVADEALHLSGGDGYRAAIRRNGPCVTRPACRSPAAPPNSCSSRLIEGDTMTQHSVHESQPASGWDADRYDRQFGYVSALAGGVVELLAPVPGETVLDLGCGTGELAATIAARGARVIAVDGDPAMVASATARLGSDVLLADGHDFLIDEQVDAVFSNAALHWMTRPAEVVVAVRRALLPGGRFVAELGGAHNVARILAAVRAALAELGLTEGARMPWYFPSPGQYATLLEAHGFQVLRMDYFARPTELTDCPGGVADWVAMFGGALIGHVPPGRRDAVLTRINELAAPTLLRDGRWYADYHRLRFAAVREPDGASDAAVMR